MPAISDVPRWIRRGASSRVKKTISVVVVLRGSYSRIFAKSLTQRDATLAYLAEGGGVRRSKRAPA
jgi:hypothetical protein